MLRLLCDERNLLCAACLHLVWLTSRSVLQSGQLCCVCLDVLCSWLHSHSATSQEARLPRGPLPSLFPHHFPPRDSSRFLGSFDLFTFTWCFAFLISHLWMKPQSKFQGISYFKSFWKQSLVRTSKQRTDWLISLVFLGHKGLLDTFHL